MDVRSIALNDILVDHGDSPRAGLDPSHVQDFVELGGIWAPLLVRPNEGEFADVHTWRLVDGFHRYAASQQLGLDSIQSEVAGADWEIEAVRRNIHGKMLTTKERHIWFNEHRLWEKSTSQRDLARDLGVNQSTISDWINTASPMENHRPGTIPPRPAPDNAELLRQQEEEGASLAQLAREHDLTDQRVADKIDTAKARRYDEERRDAERFTPYIPAPLAPPSTPRPQINIAEEMRKRNIQKSQDELAAEWWGAARKIGLGALTIASAEHQRAMIESEPGERIEDALSGIEEAMEMLRAGIAATRSQLRGGVGIIVDAEVSK
jgi:ParB-like chromosome segregation protein Spo0J